MINELLYKLNIDNHMRYMGGKHRQAKFIKNFVDKVLNDNIFYIEPFVGALSVAQLVLHKNMILSDISESLITLHRKLQDKDFMLPDMVTEEQYNEIKNIRDNKDWRTAFYGFGLSFGGKFFGGFAREKKGLLNDNTSVRRAKNSLENKRNAIFFNENINVNLLCSSYDELDIPKKSVIYCDPPYKNSTKAHDSNNFNHDLFWEWCRTQVKMGNIILVTEFIVPKDFVVLHNFGDTVVRHHNSLGHDGTNEVLVCHETQIDMFL